MKLTFTNCRMEGGAYTFSVPHNFQGEINADGTAMNARVSNVNVREKPPTSIVIEGPEGRFEFPSEAAPQLMELLEALKKVPEKDAPTLASRLKGALAVGAHGTTVLKGLWGLAHTEGFEQAMQLLKAGPP